MFLFLTQNQAIRIKLPFQILMRNTIFFTCEFLHTKHLKLARKWITDQKKILWTGKSKFELFAYNERI